MRLGGGVRAREQEAPVRVVGPARPGLLAAERPFAVTSFGPRTQAREVAARVRLAEALAEDQLAAEDLLDIRLFLPVAPERDQRRCQQGHAESAEDARRARPRHLLLVDRLHHRRRAATSHVLRPAKLQPAAFVQAPLPFALDFGLLFLAEATRGTVPPLRGQVGLEPRSDLEPEGFLLRREAKIHG